MPTLNEVYSTYTKKPLHFWYPLIAFLAFSAIAFFFILFIYMNIMVFFDFFKINSYYLIILLSLAFIYIVSGFKGSMIRGFKFAYETSQRFDTENFFIYARERNLKFFIVYLVKIIINVAIIYAAYLLFINQQLIIQIIGFSFTLLILFLINYLLHFSSIALVLYDGISSLKALKASILVSVKNVFYLIGLYILYLITLVTFFIPLINIFTLFIFYPVVETYTIQKMRQLDAKIAKEI